MRERCLDSAGNYVMAYDTTVTATLMSRVIGPDLTHKSTYSGVPSY
jgi:hypothetical protein